MFDVLLRTRRAASVFVALAVLGGSALIGAGAVHAAPSSSPTPNPSGSSSPGATGKAAPKKKAESITFGVKPFSSKEAEGRGYFTFNATAGAHVHDVAAVVNYATKPIRLAVAAADAVNTDSGGFGLIPGTATAKGVASWTTIPARYATVTVPARRTPTSAPGRVLVPFDVVVPPNASPGEHAGGITVTLRADAKAKSGQLFNLDQRVGSRIFVRVSGPSNPQLSIEDLSPSYGGGPASAKGDVTVTYRVHNTGNIVLGGKQSVSVTGLFGVEATAVKVPDLPVLLPGGSVPVKIVVKDVTPTVWMKAHVTIAPLVLPGSPDQVPGSFRASAGFVAIPWVVLVIIVLLVALVLAWFLRRFRRRPERPVGRRRRTSGDAAEAPLTEPALAGARDASTPSSLPEEFPS